MTLSSFLNPIYGFNRPPVSERGDHIHYSGSWKGGGSKGGKVSQSAISALTLLAFLFFLNILQTCLKDQLQAQSPLTIMMTTQTTTTTTEAQRHRREVEEKDLKGDPGVRVSTKGVTNSSIEKTLIMGYDEYELAVWEDNLEKMQDSAQLNKKKKKVEDVFSSLAASEPYYSPWLHSVICCKILVCPQAKEDTAGRYGNYVRKLINILCYSSNESVNKSCQACSKSQE